MADDKAPAATAAEDTQVKGVSNAALADATYRQKPKLLTKRMFKVRQLDCRFLFRVYQTSFEVQVLILE